MRNQQRADGYDTVPIPEQLEKELLRYARKSDDWIFTLNGIKPVGAKYILNNLKKEMDRIGINHNAENLTFPFLPAFL